MILILAVSLPACGGEGRDSQEDASSLRQPVVPDSMTVPRMLDTDDRFSTLRAALDSTGLDSLLASDGPYTLFAPPNKAFEALPPGTVDALLSDRQARLRTILAHHVVDARISTEDESVPTTVTTMSGDTLSLSRTSEGVSIGDVSILDANVEAANGLLHVTGQVLPPPSASNTP